MMTAILFFLGCLMSFTGGFIVEEVPVGIVLIVAGTTLILGSLG